MKDSTVRTARTVVQVVVAVAVMSGLYLAPTLDELGVDPTSVPGLAAFVAVCGLIARVSQSGAIDRLFALVGLGKPAGDGRHEGP